jgi:hypothetical protein
MRRGGENSMAYYVLRRGAQELYAMNLILSEDEARQYGSEGHMAVVKAIYVWTRIEDLESFQQFLSATQHDADSPYGGLIRDMRAERVDVLELSEAQLHDQLNRHANHIEFVAIDPGPGQRVRKIDEFLEELTA